MALATWAHLRPKFKIGHNLRVLVDPSTQVPPTQFISLMVLVVVGLVVPLTDAASPASILDFPDVGHAFVASTL